MYDSIEFYALPSQKENIVMHLSSAFPGRGTPGLPGGNQLKLKKSAPQYSGLSGLLGLFLARSLGTFSGVNWWLPLSPILPLSHCLSDLPRVKILLSDHARRLGELSNFNVKVAIPPSIPGVPHPGKADNRCISMNEEVRSDKRLQEIYSIWYAIM